MPSYRNIQGYPGYCVSDDGSVWSCQVSSQKAAVWRKLRPIIKARGYLAVTLVCAKKKRQFMVHHLILEAFVGSRPLGFHACHANGHPWDNRLSNLRWDTPRNNELDKTLHGRRPKGARNPASKLKAQDIPVIRRRILNGDKLTDIASDYGVSATAIRWIRSGRNWDHVR
jgi:hypothetical protein